MLDPSRLEVFLEKGGICQKLPSAQRDFSSLCQLFYWLRSPVPGFFVSPEMGDRIWWRKTPVPPLWGLSLPCSTLSLPSICPGTPPLCPPSTLPLSPHCSALTCTPLVCRAPTACWQDGSNLSLSHACDTHHWCSGCGVSGRTAFDQAVRFLCSEPLVLERVLPKSPE